MTQVAQKKYVFTLFSYVIRQCIRKTMEITCPYNQICGWWAFLNLVFWQYPWMRPSVAVLVHRPLAMLHWLQLHDLTHFPLHEKIIPDVYGMSHSTNIAAHHLIDMVPTWQQSYAFSSLTIKFRALQTQKSQYTDLICTLYNACLPPRTVQLWSLMHRTFTACRTLHACTHLATLQYCRAWSSSVAHSSTWHTHAFPLQTTATFKYECCFTSQFPFLNEGAKTIISVHKMHEH